MCYILYSYKFPSNKYTHTNIYDNQHAKKKHNFLFAFSGLFQNEKEQQQQQQQYRHHHPHRRHYSL